MGSLSMPDQSSSWMAHNCQNCRTAECGKLFLGGGPHSRTSVVSKYLYRTMLPKNTYPVASTKMYPLLLSYPGHACMVKL